MRNCSICGALPDSISDLDGGSIGYFCDNSECPNSGPIMTAQAWDQRNDIPRPQCAKLATCPTAIEHVRTQRRPEYRASPCAKCGEHEPAERLRRDRDVDRIKYRTAKRGEG